MSYEHISKEKPPLCFFAVAQPLIDALHAEGRAAWIRMEVLTAEGQTWASRAKELEDRQAAMLRGIMTARQELADGRHHQALLTLRGLLSAERIV